MSEFTSDAVSSLISAAYFSFCLIIWCQVFKAVVFREGGGSDLLSRGHLVTYGDTVDCRARVGGCAPGISWVEARDAAKHPAVTRTVITR